MVADGTHLLGIVLTVVGLENIFCKWSCGGGRRWAGSHRGW
jgi:hypothetical protein